MTVAKKERIKIYCDGACSGNQFKNNIGGWGAVLIFGSIRKEISGAEKNSTNQRMEIVASIESLKAITKKEIPITIFSDSAYLVNCINNRWYVKWQSNGWKNSKKLKVENRNLWEELLLLLENLDVEFKS